MENSSVFYIEQNLLPFEFRISEARTVRDCCIAIRTMKIRGAGAIGAMAGFAMALAFMESSDGGFTDPGTAKKEIESTRPTARNLFYATDRVYAAGLRSVAEALVEAQAVADRDASDSRTIGELGNSLIHDGWGIMTHCNAGWLAFVDYGTALSPHLCCQ